jgi:hypothetical protein
MMIASHHSGFKPENNSHLTFFNNQRNQKIACKEDLLGSASFLSELAQEGKF